MKKKINFHFQRCNRNLQKYWRHSFLDNGYTVFGEVIEGLEIIDSICSVPTLKGDIPITPVIILSTKINE